ncbi:fumarylacetoacetate hydrolase family protein [Salinicoccus roseus]|uniref:fumarylacetoacetate hydrolase family protein n=1 Tax=Salinicoccus roseus TaxID=45670 RepID=UPI001CA7A699|nr:fumarylacetoacetate hydrolase family protein [Salinicoccus roseus]MBY8909156.1 fumarylacetoacetate hydrolase family protein [Salinicoccus roseus]
MANIKFKHQGIQLMQEGLFEAPDSVMIDAEQHNISEFNFDVPINGTVYGALLNFKGAYAQYEGQLNDDPYKAPPKAPILYIKPINTYIGDGEAVPMPQSEETLSAGAALAVVIGKTATRLEKSNALDHVAGYTIVNDISIPHESIYRPAYKEKARDGFCPIGPWITERDSVGDPNALKISVYVNGELKAENNTSNLIRSVEGLLADVTEFMTLYEGDVLLVGVPEDMPLLKAGDTVKVEVEGIGVLENEVLDENQVAGGKRK